MERDKQRVRVDLQEGYKLRALNFIKGKFITLNEFKVLLSPLDLTRSLRQHILQGFDDKVWQMGENGEAQVGERVWEMVFPGGGVHILRGQHL